MKTYGIIVKLGVSDNAEYPDSSAGNSSKTGFFIEKPEASKAFYFYEDEEMNCLFRTSRIVEIIKETDTEITFKTNNSVYQLTFNLFD